MYTTDNSSVRFWIFPAGIKLQQSCHQNWVGLLMTHVIWQLAEDKTCLVHVRRTVCPCPFRLIDLQQEPKTFCTDEHWWYQRQLSSLFIRCKSITKDTVWMDMGRLFYTHEPDRLTFFQPSTEPVTSVTWVISSPTQFWWQDCCILMPAGKIQNPTELLSDDHTDDQRQFNSLFITGTM